MIFFKATTTPTSTLTFPSFSNNANCDFETDYCDYIPNFRFERWKGKAPADQFKPSSGPDADHTTGSGYYALCVGKKLANDNDFCTLNKTFTNNNEVKFTFWYYLYGTTVGSLELKKNDESVWSDSTQLKAWKKGEIDFPIGTYTV